MKHIPTGITTTGQSHKDRTSNQREAFRTLTDKLVPLMKAAARLPRDGDHSTEKVRTYNYKRGTAKDERTQETVSLDEILDGKVLTRP